MITTLEFLRGMVFAVFAFAVLVALGAWSVRTRHVHPSSSVGRIIGRVVDPVLRPLERWLGQRGRNPQNAGWWLVGLVLVGGILIISVAEWLIRQVFRLASAGARGPFEVVQLLVYYAAQLVAIALIVRVIGSWFGAGPFNPWMRWAYRLTDWLVEPLRRFIPPLGVIDLAPLVAWLAIQVLLGLFMSL